MDINVIRDFLEQRLPTKAAVEEAASAAGVSAATMYRYKSNPEGMGLGTLIRLNECLGLPLENGAAWSKADIISSEYRRLSLEKAIAGNGGSRYTTVSPYTVNSELEPLTRALIRADYGTRAPQIENEILRIRASRQQLYDSCAYASWEIWNGNGYLDFFHGRGRFNQIPADLRKAQVKTFIESSRSENRHRFIYMNNCPELPMFGAYTPSGIALVRIEDIHLEYQAPALVKSFQETFDELLTRCVTRTTDQFIDFISNPS